MSAATGGRVTYLRCNVCDPDEVAGAVAQVLAAEGRVDVVLNAAGINRSGLMRGKRLEDFRAVRDLMVLAYVNLKRALAGQSPLWCNFSSYIGLKGQIGETDYAAANDFIATASAFAGNVRGDREFAIGWNLWSEVGLGATPLMKSFLSKRVWYTQMPTAEGIDHFLSELDQPRHDPWSVFMGDAEREHLGLPDAVDGGAPSAVEPAETRPPSSSFFLGVATTRAAEEVCFKREFSLERDAYLRHHVVNGTPTLPGTFAIEIAAEAARALVPDRIPVRFEQLVFSSFLRVPPGRAVTKRVRATVLGRRPAETVVAVRVTTDVTAPDGRVLAADRPHFACVVHLRERVPIAPLWERPDRPADATPYEDPYHVANPAVHLTGPFVTAEDFWVHRLGCGATFAPTIAPDDPVFSTLSLPVVLLDGLLRVSVPDQAPDIARVLAVPASIARLDLYHHANDSALAAAATPIHFASVAPDGLGRGGRAVASFANGRVLAQIDEMRAVVVGELDELGGFHPAAARSPEDSAAWA
jgi:hypothetical protein